MKSKILIGYCTFPDRETAESICQELVEQNLIACANIFAPHKAIYSWLGKTEKTQEVAAILKLNARKQASVMEKFRAKHPYSVPALVFWPIEGGAPEFLNWVYGQSL
jgi:periplasmic divalent cation tolerance protein